MPLGTSASNSKPARTGKARASKSGTSGAKQQDAIRLLTADHDEVEALFKQFRKAKDDDSQKAGIVGQICTALTVHAEIEEEIFYPAARDALAEKGEDMLDEAEVEHASIKSLVEQLKDADPGEEMYDAKVKVLCEYVNHHVREEEKEIFPKVKKTKLDLDELGAELMDRKTELMGEE
jgi:hemerythrin superfamily protein